MKFGLFLFRDHNMPTKRFGVSTFVAIVMVFGFISDIRSQIWEQANPTHRATQIITSDGKNIFSIAGHLFHSSDLGNTFTVIFPDASITGFAKGSTGIFYLSSPKGLDTTTDPVNGNWVMLPASNVPSVTALFVRASPSAPGADDIFAGSATGLWYRKSSDAVWQKLYDPGDGAPILQIATFNKNIYFRSGSSVFASHDEGSTWKNITPTTFGTITAIVTTSDTDLFIAVSGNPSSIVFHSTNSGNSFNGLRGVSFASHTIQALNANSKGDLYLGGGVRDDVNQDSITSGFAFRLLNNGSAWEDYSLGLPSSPPTPEIIALGFTSGGNVLASTDSAGLWRTLLPSGVSQVQNRIGIVLSQNYPNPASTSTDFSVFCDHTIKASLSVFDALGRNVLQIFSGELSQGTNFFKIDTKNLPNGMYFYGLECQEVILTKSFMITK
jgi:hypothetical protein